MSRNSAGTYSLPEAPFIANTTILAGVTNSNNSDIADALTDSLSRTGLGGMSTALSLATGGFFYASDPDTGMSRASANTQVITVGGEDYTFTADDLTNPDGISLLPLIGEIRMWARTTAPTGWILMRGQAATTSYPLWRAALIADGSPYGTSGSDPLFPNMQCVVPAGLDATSRGLLTGSTVLGALLGVQTKTLLTANLPPYTPAGSVTVGAHSHQVKYSLTNVAAGVNPVVATINTGQPVTGNSESATPSGSFTGTAQGGTSDPVSIVQPTIIINFIGRAA